MKAKAPFEIFDGLKNIKSFHDRIKYLQEHNTFATRTILQCGFTKGIILDLPEGAPPFNRDTLPPENTMSRIDRSIKILGKLVKTDDKTSTISRLKKERLFINLLEGVNGDDADVIIAMKDKELTKLFPNLTLALVKKAFPNLVP